MGTIGEELRLRRLLIPARQQLVAVLAGIPQSKLSRIENGWLTPNDKTVERIRNILDQLAKAQPTQKLAGEVGMERV